MLDAYVIEEIKRREREQSRDDRPVVELPVPQPPPSGLRDRRARRGPSDDERPRRRDHRLLGLGPTDPGGARQGERRHRGRGRQARARFVSVPSGRVSKRVDRSRVRGHIPAPAASRAARPCASLATRRAPMNRDHQRRPRARSWTPAATRPSRSRSRSRPATVGRAAVPSGASTGEHEALELRDGDKGRYLGKGVRKAVANVIDVIAPAVIGHGRDRSGGARRADDRRSTARRRRRSSARTRSSASRSPPRAPPRIAHELPLYRYVGGASARTLPVPLMNILNGGAHADSNVDIQEFMVVPLGAPSFAEALRYGAEIFHALKKRPEEAAAPATGVGDEGGFAPSLAVERGGARAHHGGDRAGGPQARRAGRARARRAPSSEFFDKASRHATS